jgi:hypothetical protein
MATSYSAGLNYKINNSAVGDLVRRFRRNAMNWPELRFEYDRIFQIRGRLQRKYSTTGYINLTSFVIVVEAFCINLNDVHSYWSRICIQLSVIGSVLILTPRWTENI